MLKAQGKSGSNYLMTVAPQQPAIASQFGIRLWPGCQSAGRSVREQRRKAA